MKQDMYYIYMHKNKINGKVYIGQTKKTPALRWGVNGSGYMRQPYFFRAILKYGWDSFEHIILETCLTLEEANALEKKYIAEYHSCEIDFGYNLTDGGNVCIRSELSKQKIRGKNNPFYGKHHTKETKQKISSLKKGTHHKHSEETKIKIGLGNKGKTLSKEQRKRMSVIMTGRYVGDKSPSWGKHPSLETRQKMRLCRLGKKLSYETKKKVGAHSREMVKNGTHPTAGKYGKDNPNYGKRFFNNGIKNVFCLNCPEGFVPGILYKNGPYGKSTKWYTNGLVNIRANECPDGFYLGLTKNNNFAKGV